MGSYTVITGQNIYDIALALYGSVQGVIDLMMVNEQLSFTTDLRSGDVLEYTDEYILNESVRSYNKLHDIVPANGERQVYTKEAEYPLLFELLIPPQRADATIRLSGGGIIQVDWGDNSKLQYFELLPDEKKAHHVFDNLCTERKIRIYGQATFTTLDFSGLYSTQIRMYRPVEIKSLNLSGNRGYTEFIRLIQGLENIDLSYSKYETLLPLIAQRELKAVELGSIQLAANAMDKYLIALASEHESRQGATIRMNRQPSGTYQEPPRDSNGNYELQNAMQAVWLLTNEAAWNENSQWQIIINEHTYSYTP